jgi:hypothetical protein
MQPSRSVVSVNPKAGYPGCPDYFTHAPEELGLAIIEEQRASFSLIGARSVRFRLRFRRTATPMSVNVLPDFRNFQQRFLETAILLDPSFCL